MSDAIIIGSGHNALISACYLARAGWSTTVLERDTVIGGAVSTVELFRGHRVDRGSSAHLMIRHSGIIEELELAQHGLRYLECDPWAFAPAEPSTGQPGIVFHQDLDATCESIDRACGARDARAYRAFVHDWAPRSQKVMRAFARPPAPSSLIRSFWGLDTDGDPAQLSRDFLASGDALLDYYFDSERLKAALSWFGAQSGPPTSEPGTAPMVGFAALMHALPPGRAVGGSGALTEALAARLREDDGQIHRGDAVDCLEREGHDWIATTASGKQHRAATVIAGCHVLTTLEMLARGGYDARRIETWRRRIRVGPGLGMAVRLRSSALPSYPSAGPAGDTVLAGLQLLATDRSHLRRAHGAMLAGDRAERPVALAMTFSAIDPTLAPPGEHQLTLWSQWQPYALRGHDWDDVAEQESDRIIAELERYAPGLSEGLLDRYIQTPKSLASELGLLGGNVMHVEMGLDQMMLWRPVPPLARHRVPAAPGMYITGASTHPGGGVSGFSGRSAARLALRDARFGGARNRLAWPR
ncbi:NAD(P)/FAD-dependent oxidoreductase [Hoyosella sp. G463]|uniref:NAD(P)/FAD-dependent oxidoreductase n=1 Tax=Lolliginicoccus lacisalsi TaxID=2742202 RepID=A0A927JEE5_9ACTN|nr:NAD(P)/FAD-dependent oxidoreductase [Lolliginicoccus lacisalsi]